MFGLRFDIDSHYGLTRRLPALLEVLEKHRAKATFFCVMGRDPSLRELLHFRVMAKRSARRPVPAAAADRTPIDVEPVRTPGRSHFLRNPAKVLHTLSYPRRVGTARPDLLRRLVQLGHEVYPHGWSHIQWQRNLANIDADRHIRLCIEAHRAIFGQDPLGFASPGMVYDEAVLELFDRHGFAFVGDLHGEAPFVPDNHRAVQIPVTTRRTISWLSWKGYAEHDIVDLLYRHIANRQFSVIFDHPDNLRGVDLRVLDGLLARLAASGIESRPFSQLLQSATC